VIVALRDLKKQCEIEESVTAHDPYLVDLEAAAVAHIEKRTGRYYGTAGSVTEIIRGTGGPRLWLSEPAIERDSTTDALPISVIERYGPGSEETTILAADADGYVLRNNGLALYRKDGGIWSSLLEYEVTYTRGNATLPADLEHAVKVLVAWWFEMRIPAALGTVAPDVDNHLSQILASHVRRPWA
jgi:hypothetical protein